MPIKSNMYKFYRWPNPARGEFSRPFGGIVEVLRQYSRFLPVFGWLEVATEEEADLVVGHLGVETDRLDVFHLHGLMPTADGGSPQDFKTNALIIDNIRRARHVICVSDWVADILRRDMHMSPSVIGHGFDWEMWGEVPPVEFNDKRPKVLWNKTRNWGVCDPTAVIELAKRLPDVDFVTTFLPRKMSSAPSNVKVTGLLARWEAWRVAKGVDVYLGTTKETFGVGALEAMASSISVVGFRHGATPQVVGDIGLFVDPGDYDGLAEAVKEGLERKEELGEQGLERAKLFTWSKVVRRVANVYEEVLLGRKPKSPRVTVVIPCYNKEAFIAEAIQSVRNQSFADWELIVVDDGSSDDSAGKITRAIDGEARARLVLHDKNRGVAHARNTGIAEGSGEYVWCLDADDGCEPRYLETMVDGIDEDQRLAIVYTGITVMDAKGKLRDKPHAWPAPYEPKRGLAGNQVPTSCLYKREWWKRTGGYRQRYAPHGAGQEDADFWLRILASGGGAKMVSEEGMFHYRMHKDQVTRVHRDDWNKDLYLRWYPFRTDGKHPLASQLAVPDRFSWPVRDYDKPQVAIVVPVGPHHRSIMQDALDSVEAQSFRDWELIVVNDSGPPLDLTAWPYARVVEAGEGMGPGHARNVGTEIVRAPLVVYLDADDILQPTFIEDTLHVWLQTGGWVYTDLHHIALDGSTKVYQTQDWDSGRLWKKGLAAVTALYPVEAWREVGGFDEEIQHEDWVFHIDLALAGWCGNRLPKPLITYRHATGFRRAEGIEAKGFKDVRKKYTEKSLMDCPCSKGGGRKTKARPVAPAATPTTSQRAKLAAQLDPSTLKPPPDGSHRLMVYVGRSAQDLVFKGKAGRTYVFSTKRSLAWVNREDVGRLSRKSVLHEVNVGQLKQAISPGLEVPRTA